jgi:hypothetical protein
MVRYRWTATGFKDAAGNPMPVPERDGVCLPMVVSDIKPYACPITGKMITSRSEHRDNLAKHGMRVVEPDESPTKGKIRNEAFARKRGLKVSDEFKDYDSAVRKHG